MSEYNQDNLPPGTVSAYPTKKFFVAMLTRDIALMDAIMDLLDNCIDGVHRQNRFKGSNQNDYNGYFGEITINENEFILKDNCGGIPLEIAKNYAFKMGRSDDYHDDDNLETLGMYGIGMKRAIFKIGLEAEVTSYHQNDKFKVSVPKDWSTTGHWYFDYTELDIEQIRDVLDSEGTSIRISNLHQNISSQFKDESGFVKDLTILLRNHYGYIVEQGFKVKLNGVEIEPLELNILTYNAEGNSKVIKPYVYTAAVEGVDVEVIIGFYRPPANEDEIEQELEGGFAKSQSENAGVTVICNDRVVLYCDKTFLTGWGEIPVPKYHTQFIAIAGVVHFRSNNPIKLPVTTTKRGLDTSSTVYAEVKNKIKEGLRYFTSFTNNWKTPSEERSKLFESAIKINALIPGQTKSPLIKLEVSKRGETAQYQIPDLPKPNDAINELFVNISFKREKVKVQEIRDYFLDGGNKSASEVGAWCFDEIRSHIE